MRINTTMTDEGAGLSISDAARRLGISSDALHNYAQHGDIPYARTARGWRFASRDLEIAAAWLESEPGRVASNDSPYRDDSPPPRAA